MMQKYSPKRGSRYSSNSSTSGEEKPCTHYFISKKFIAPEPTNFPAPTFEDLRLR